MHLSGTVAAALNGLGVDVVNMSFFTDPWLSNCLDNPADSPAEQQEQRTIREATQRALDFVRAHGVLTVAALGNQSTDLGNPTIDNPSPDFPPGTERHRTVDNSRIKVPTESNGVVAVSALGPSGRKSFYSNFGVEQTDVSGPGGDSREDAPCVPAPRAHPLRGLRPRYHALRRRPGPGGLRGLQNR